MLGMTTSPQLRESPATANFHDSAAAGSARKTKSTVSFDIVRIVLLLRAGVERVAESVADHVECGDGEEDGHAGEEHQPPGVLDVLLGGGQDAPPRGGGNLN